MSVESNRMLLKHHLEKLRLPTIRREWESAAAACAKEGSDYGDFLLRLTERELIERENELLSVVSRTPSSRCSRHWRTSTSKCRHPSTKPW